MTLGPASSAGRHRENAASVPRTTAIGIGDRKYHRPEFGTAPVCPCGQPGNENSLSCRATAFAGTGLTRHPARNQGTACDAGPRVERGATKGKCRFRSPAIEPGPIYTVKPPQQWPIGPGSSPGNVSVLVGAPTGRLTQSGSEFRQHAPVDSGQSLHAPQSAQIALQQMPRRSERHPGPAPGSKACSARNSPLEPSAVSGSRQM